MTEQQGDYITDANEILGAGYNDQPAAIIDNPRTVKALRDTGLFEYRAWGWVKLSAKFIAHLRHLKGAKLAIWQCIALSIDETGVCKMSYKDIGALTDYSHTEVIESVKELEAAGYLTINKDGKTNIYQPVFVARGENKPKETLGKKLDSTPAYLNESSPAIVNSVPSIKELKELNTSQTTNSTLQGIEASIYSGRPTTQADVDATNAQNATGAGWRGREMLPPHYLTYGDWWHAKTGLHMYGSKAKPKADASYLKAFKAWYENELTAADLQSALDGNKWRNISDPHQITKDAIAIHALPNQPAAPASFISIQVTK